MVGLSEGEGTSYAAASRTRRISAPMAEGGCSSGRSPSRPGSSHRRMVQLVLDWGGTEVIASVKAELGKPSILHTGKGKVNIFVDCSPTAEPTFEGRRSEELPAELSIVLGRCLLGAKSGTGATIDLSTLIIVDGKLCWDLYIDGLVISSDAVSMEPTVATVLSVSVILASSPHFSLLCMVALSDTCIPKVNVSVSAASDDEPKIDVSDEEFLQFDTSGVLLIITLTKVGRQYIVDANSEEESQMSSAVSVLVNRHGHICGLTKRGGAGLDPTAIFDMITVAKHVSQQFIALFDSEIAAAQAEQ